MKKRLIKQVVSLIIFFIFIISALTFAADKYIVRTQGVVMEVDLTKNRMIVNEKQIVWNQHTAFFNEKGSPTTFDKIKIGIWVYVEGMNDKPNRRVSAEKIYTLPKYINAKERHFYPFIQ